MKTILSVLIGVTLALSAGQGGAQSVAGETRVSLVIESKPLDQALDEWARQSGFQIFLQNWDVAKKLTAPNLRGTFSAKAALEQLLAGTPLTYKWLSERAVAIRERTQADDDATNLGSATWGSYFRSTDHPLRLALLDPEQSDPERVAQASPSGGIRSGVAGGEVAPATIDEVIVTGTSIRGVTPAGSPLTVYTRSDITKTGSASVREFMRKVPQNFSLTDTETVQNNGVSALADVNTSRGSGINLHGLGAGTTLTLVDGQRLAPSGFEGSFVDISLIPLSAVERVEMLTDGASAIYGADAVGGVVNFILRRDFEGGETSVRYGDATRGGGEQLTVAQLLGASWADGNAMFIYEYENQESVDVKDREFIPPIPALTPGPFTIFPEQRRNSFVASARHGFTPNFEFAARGFFSTRDFAEDASTFVGLSHTDGEAESAGGTLTAQFELSDSWSVTAAADYSRGKQDSTVTSTLAGATRSSLESMSTGINIRVSGTLFELPNSNARMSIGASGRRESFDQNTRTPDDFEREVKSGYAEVFLPLIAPPAGAEGQKLEVSLAGRIDDYDDFGSSGVKPKAGIAWSPNATFGLRASWSESFRAPLLSEMNSTMLSPFRWFVLNLPDPTSPTGVTPTILPLVLGNPDLDPEKAESLTFGVDLTPTFAPNFRASVTYYDVDYTDRISTPPLPGGIFFLFRNAATLAPFIHRSPDPALIASLYAEGVQNPFGIPSANVRALYDARYQNIASMRTSGFEAAISNTFDTSLGALAPFIHANYISDLKTRAASTTAEEKLFDRIFTPARLRLNGGLSWTRASLSTTLSVNYVNEYANNTQTPPVDIDEWITFDWYLQYDVGQHLASPMLRGLNLALSVQNLTDEEPPQADVPRSLQTFNFGYDATNSSAMGRFVSLQVSKRW